jgi:NAD-dependent deacetylase
VGRRSLEALVAGAGRVCVLTGAGVSTAAGLPDVRGLSGRGSWTRRIALDEFLASAQARAAYWQQEETFFQLVQRAEPSAAHHGLASLWRRGRLTGVVTQNVDGLHQAAGLPDEAVVELHGSLHRSACVDCGRGVPRAGLSAAAARGDSLYCLLCRGLLKGGATMFGEPIDPALLDAALRALLEADLLLVLGTSLRVAPAADVVRWARDAGVPVAVVNATATPLDGEAVLVLHDDVNEVLGDLAAAEARGDARGGVHHPASLQD